MRKGAADEAYLRRIVEESATIAERVHGEFEPVIGSASADLASERLSRWRAKLSVTNPSAFDRRLDWLGTSAAEVAPLLGEVRFAGELPPWSIWLGHALEAPSAGPAPDCPFGALIAPFVSQARQAIAPALHNGFTSEAIEALLSDLAEELSHIAAPSFYLAFSALRSARGGAVPGATTVYDLFVADMLAGGMHDFLLDYPVLGRLLAVTLSDFVDNSLALGRALQADLEALEQEFAGGRTVEKVVAVRSSLSDRHNGGRTVSLLSFASGQRLIYKPRDIGVERAWFDLLAELNARGGGEFGLLRVLARPLHGWVEFAEPAPCADAADLTRYYRRAGMLLAMLYAMEASDCFFENIVARGAWPLLIDMETLMHPVIRGRSDLSPAEMIADDMLFNSVFRAGFLPAWEMGPAGHCVDISGLAAEPGQETSYVKRVWRDANSDAMTLAQEPISVDRSDHLPIMGGAPGRVADHVEDVIAGFTQIYRLILSDLAAFAGPEGIARRFAGSEIRFVFHATRIYGLVLKRLGAPRHMRSGVERSIEMDVISRFYLDSHKQDRFRQILDAETASLDRLDIPKFTVRADERSLRLPTGVCLDDLFEESAIERVQRRVASFSEDDLRLQSEFIRASLDLASTVMQHEPIAAAVALDTMPPVSSDELIAEAQVIGAELAARAIMSSDGGATWIAPQLLPGANRHEFRPLRMDLYSGVAGVALFFAALDRVTGSGRDLALAALAPLRRYLKTADASRMVRDGYTLGAATGVGSFAASLAWCGELLDEPVLLVEAVAFSSGLSPKWIDDDDAYDVMAGSAGATLGLLSLYRRSGSADVLAKAVACGNHLIARADTVDVGLAWRPPGGGRHLTGLSHGTAGIATALSQLGIAAGEARFVRAAEQAIAYERAVFDREHGNWPDFRQGGEGTASFMHSWCHGAPGIGLARAAGGGDLSAYDRADLEAAFRTTARHGIGDRDGVCCGALGRAELFLVKAALDSDAEADTRARQWAAQVLARKRSANGYRLTGRAGQEFFDPSFFQGLSGIGYQLLRTADPRLPSVLSWQ
ncbi:type 2 lanthipeptide synthetase LanM family protein [Sphingomonas sp. HF-S3]|uniref:Type 2 lanthipeptide synthetase LanM family protein n=1 Tax=Sphingomonas rustica TaxID=3103142 RepID=A0ABV0B4S2_9SPHN